jgi:hypothetical protein
VLGIFLAACSAGNAPGVAEFAERDSAGIAIATNAASGDTASLPIAWTVDTTGALWIKAVDSIATTHFNQIAAVVLTADGGVVVGNGAPPELRVFDANGKFVRKMG